MLFRREALAARRSGALGPALIKRPLSLTLLTLIFGACALAFVLFLALASYTRRTTVAGELAPRAGLILVYPSEPGTVLERRVLEGQHVRAGDTLFAISGERDSSTRGPALAATTRSVEARKQSLSAEITRLRGLEHAEHSMLEARVAALSDELVSLDGEIEAQAARRTLLEQEETRYGSLAEQGFVSRTQWAGKHADLLEAQAHSAQLSRTRQELSRQRDEERVGLASLSRKYENEVAPLEQGLASADQDLLESEARRRVNVDAPIEGTVSALLAAPGQAVDVQHPVVSLLPLGAPLCAELYAPSRSMAFVHVGERVLLRLDAYPYQKFGHLAGVVEAVASSSLPVGAFTIASGAPGLSGNEPVYRIIVRLEDQALSRGAVVASLVAGMRVEAELIHERRRLYEWLFDPLDAWWDQR